MIHVVSKTCRLKDMQEHTGVCLMRASPSPCTAPPHLLLVVVFQPLDHDNTFTMLLLNPSLQSALLDGDKIVEQDAGAEDDLKS